MSDILTPARVYRRNRTFGVPDSGVHEPVKSEIVQLLERIEQSSAAGLVVRQTEAELLAITPSTNEGAWVLNDPDPTKNGYWFESSGAWVKGRGFPDTFAAITLAGTANAQTGTVGSGVNPAEVEVYYAVVTTANTGPMTLSISGETARDVVNAAGNALSAGEWTGVVLFFLNDDGDYQLIIDAGAAAAAAQSATDAAASLAEFNEKYVGAFADDASATAGAGGSPVTGGLYWNTTTGQLKTWDGAAWQVSSASIPDGAITDVKVATPATPADGISSSKIAYLLSATDAASRSLADKLGESVSVKDFKNADGNPARGNGVRLWADVTISSGSAALTVSGASFTAEDVGKLIIVSGAGASGVDLVTSISAYTDAENVTLAANAGTTVTATEKLVRYGTDDTAAILAALSHITSNLPGTLFFPKGVYFYTGMGNLNYDGLTVAGSNMLGTVLVYCGSGGSDTAAVKVDAFPGTEVNPFVQDNNWRDMTIEAHSDVANIVSLQGVARSYWENINLREGCTLSSSSNSRYAMYWRGVMLSRFTGIYCSDNLQPMATMPFGGFIATEGRRNGVSVGNSANDILQHCYWEGMEVGVNLARCDQLLMLGGSPEKCSQYGMIVASPCRYNTFIGVGFENLGSTADISDSAMYSRYINCYASEEFRIQGRGAIVEGGFFELIAVGASAVKCKVENVTINWWNTGSGGFTNGGTDTEYKNIYDADAGAYIYPTPSRTAISVGASPFSWTNDTGQVVEVIIQGGTVSDATQVQGVDTWTIGSGTNKKCLLRPTDAIRVTYTAAPSMSYIRTPGYQG